MKNTELAELNNFALSAKFKVSGTCAYTYFNIDATKQIRIYRNNKTTANVIKYQVTLHSISKDNITYLPYECNTAATSLKEAKLIAASYYFNTIRSN